MKFPVRPILGRVIIEIETSGEDATESGIVVSLDSSRGQQQRDGRDRVGVVVAIDDAFYNSPRNAPHIDNDNVQQDRKSRPDINLGDRVFFAVSWAGDSFERDGKKFHVLEGDDAAALVPDGVKVEALTR